MKISLFLFIGLSFLLSGCTQKMFDFTIISTKNMEFEKAATFERGPEMIEGEDRIHLIIFIPTGQPEMEDAIDKAIESVPGCVALVNGEMYSKMWWIPYIYGQSSYIVEGTPIIDPNLVNSQKEFPAYGKIELGRNGQIKVSEGISPAKYYTLRNKLVKSAGQKRF